MSDPAPRADSHITRLRLAELALLRPYIMRNARVLEIGGGNGFQAAVLTSWGCDVTSIDINSNGRWARQYFPVSTYDGAHLPFESSHFDIVFSSNVLEHVRGLQDLLVETARVLRLGGNAVHVLPTPLWRLWTILTHYPYLVKRIVIGRTEDVGLRSRSENGVAGALPVAEMAWRALVPQAHGEFRSSIDEIFQYRRSIWQERFAAAGLDLQQSIPTGIFYTGNAIFPDLSLRARCAVSRVLGSACQVFILRHRDSLGDP